MRLKLTTAEATYLIDALDIWIEGYQDIGEEEIPTEVMVDLLDRRQAAEDIRNRIHKGLKRGRKF
jgi:hypothetical protein